MVKRANASFELAEGTAEFLSGAPVIRRFSTFVHGKSGVTDQVAFEEMPVSLSIALFERDKGFTGINRFHGVIVIEKSLFCF